MNMFARFDENPAMTFQDIKETKRYGRMENVKTVYPPQTKFAGGIIMLQRVKIGPIPKVTCFSQTCIKKSSGLSFHVNC